MLEILPASPGSSSRLPALLCRFARSGAQRLRLKMVEASVREIRREIEARAVSLDLTELAPRARRYEGVASAKCAFHTSSTVQFRSAKVDRCPRGIFGTNGQTEKFDSGQINQFSELERMLDFGRWSSRFGKPESGCKHGNQ
jgi:hypothetical protein